MIPVFAGSVAVTVPLAEFAFKVVTPLDEPLRARSPLLIDWTPLHVFAPLRSGIVAPLVPVAVEHPVAPLERLEQVICEPLT